MSAQPSNLTEAQAEALMSLLLDGELPASEAARLADYLEQRPEALDWMQSWDALRDARESDAALATTPQDIRAIEAKIAALAARPAEQAKAAPQRAPATIVPFPRFFKPLAAAAAIAVAGSLLWLGWQPTSQAPEVSVATVVEFVETDIPNASTFVYSDEESDWTVVWVEAMAPLPSEHG